MAGLGGRHVDDHEKAATPHEPRVTVVERGLPVHVGGLTGAEDDGAVDLGTMVSVESMTSLYVDDGGLAT